MTREIRDSFFFFKTLQVCTKITTAIMSQTNSLSNVLVLLHLKEIYNSSISSGQLKVISTKDICNYTLCGTKVWF